MARQMALVREAHGKRNLRQRELGSHQHLLRAADPSLYKVMMRGNTRRLLEFAGEMKQRKAGDPSQHPEIYQFA
jgi:hypothetical protein